MSSMQSACGHVRRLLWPDSGPKSTSLEVIDAQAHLAQCAACQRFVREMRAEADFLRGLALREEAPPAVRHRLFGAVARARAGMQPSSRRLVPAAWLTAATALLTLLGGALALDHVLRHRSVDPMVALVEDHARALADAQIVSADPAVVSGWLAPQLHFAMIVPALPNGRLLGARLRVMDGRRGAAVPYEINGKAVTYFVVPDGSNDPEPASAAARQRFERLTRAGYRIVAWREPGLPHAMVGNLSDTQLVTLAEACIKQARGAVALRPTTSNTPPET